MFGQLFSIGVKGGVPFTGSFKDITSVPSQVGGAIPRTFSDSNNYIVGGMAEVHLPFGFSVEADGLYRPLNFATELRTPATSVTIRSSQNVSSWEFPIVAKYHFAFPVIKPYIEAGPTFRTVGSGLDYLSNKGVVGGVGVELKLGRLRVGPEVRYTRWGSDSAQTLVKLIQPGPSQVNQAEFLVGLSF